MVNFNSYAFETVNVWRIGRSYVICPNYSVAVVSIFAWTVNCGCVCIRAAHSFRIPHNCVASSRNIANNKSRMEINLTVAVFDFHRTEFAGSIFVAQIQRKTKSNLFVSQMVYLLGCGQPRVYIDKYFVISWSAPKAGQKSFGRYACSSSSTMAMQKFECSRLNFRENVLHRVRQHKFIVFISPECRKKYLFIFFAIVVVRFCRKLVNNKIFSLVLWMACHSIFRSFSTNFFFLSFSHLWFCCVGLAVVFVLLMFSWNFVTLTINKDTMHFT